MNKLLISSMRSFRDGGAYSRLLRSLRDNGVDVAVVSANPTEEEFIREVLPEVSFFPRGLGSWPPNFSQKPVLPEELAWLMTGDDYVKFKFTVMSSLDRHDASGTFRMIDREMYFIEAFSRLAGVLTANGITHVAFDITPHVSTEYILYWVAKKLGLRVIFFQPVPFAGFSLVRSSLEDFCDLPSNPILEDVEGSIQNFFFEQFRGLVNGLSKGNASWVRNFQASEIRKLSEKKFGVRKVLKVFSDNTIPKNVVHFSGGSNTPQWLRVLLYRVMTYFLRSSFQRLRSSRNSGPRPGRRDLLFAMTHQPERTFFPEALPHTSQLEVLLEVRDLFEGFDRVLVKEHDTQFAPGRLGFAGRSPIFYRWAAGLPNVELIPSSMESLPYIVGSGGVVSATGTICIEAALLGIPSYYYGNPWWAGFPGTTKIEFQGQKIPSTRAMPVPPDSEQLSRFFALLLSRSAITTSNVEPEQFESKFAKLPPGYEDTEVEFLLRTFSWFLSK